MARRSVRWFLIIQSSIRHNRQTAKRQHGKSETLVRSHDHGVVAMPKNKLKGTHKVMFEGLLLPLRFTPHLYSLAMCQHILHPPVDCTVLARAGEPTAPERAGWGIPQAAAPVTLQVCGCEVSWECGRYTGVPGKLSLRTMPCAAMHALCTQHALWAHLGLSPPGKRRFTGRTDRCLEGRR